MRERLSALLAKPESVYGTDASPTGGANAILISNLNVTPLNQELISRDLMRPYYGNSEQLAGASWKTVSFTAEVASSGAAGTAPPWGALMRGCGMGETVTEDTSVAYAPISASEESVTLYCNYDGQLHKLLGGRGTWSLSIKARARPTFDFSFTGLFAAITDAALPACDFAAWRKPLVVTNTNTPTFTLHTYAAKLMELSLSGNVEAQYRNMVGLEEVRIVDRAPSGSVTFEPPPIAQKDFVSIARAGTAGALQLIHGTAGGDKFQLDMPAVQLMQPDLSPQSKLRYQKLNLSPIPSSGNDEIVITAL